jgi:hypothetical protein
MPESMHFSIHSDAIFPHQTCRLQQDQRLCYVADAAGGLRGNHSLKILDLTNASVDPPTRVPTGDLAGIDMTF